MTRSLGRIRARRWGQRIAACRNCRLYKGHHKGPLYRCRHCGINIVDVKRRLAQA